jgi:hypothetical protein
VPQRDADELLRGWQAAEACEPYDPSASASWREGYRLYESRESCRSRYRTCPSYSAAIN